MMRRDFAEYVREHADIVRIISDYVALRKRGSNYWALCPFHREKTPSFAVHPVKQIFKCFGCGIGGDVFTFVQQIEGCSFWEAVRSVAEACGLPLPTEIPASGRTREDVGDTPADPKIGWGPRGEAEWRERLRRINEWACDFFVRCLRESVGHAARAYLQSRGISHELAERFHLGYAPAEGRALARYLLKRGVTQTELERSGLLGRFRHRVIFPIRDVRGRIVGFGGRALETSDEPKYVNSPETALYVKGRHVFGLYEARQAIAHQDEVILVEGYFDWLTLIQHGIENVVASLGTALTDEQARVLRRYASRVVLNFDADRAGRQAMVRNLERLIEHGFDVRVLCLPEGEDPDSFLRREGAEEYRRRIRTAAHHLDFLLDEMLRDVAPPFTPTVQARALRELAPYIARIPDEVERAIASDHVAARLGVNPQLVRSKVKRGAMGSPADRGIGRSVPDASEAQLESRHAIVLCEAERLVLEILLHADRETRAQILRELEPEDVRDLPSRPLFDAMWQLDGPPDSPLAPLLERFRDDPVMRDLLERLAMVEVSGSPEELIERARGGIMGLRRDRLRRELEALRAQIAACRSEDELMALHQRQREVAALLAQYPSKGTSGRGRDPENRSLTR